MTIKISEINTNPPGPDRVEGKWVNLDLEYVKLENTTSTPINISGWKLKDFYCIKNNAYQHIYTFPANTHINKELYVRTGVKKGAGHPNSVYQDWPTAIWNNDGDIAALYKIVNSKEKLVDYKEVGNKVLGAMEGYVKDADTKKGFEGAEVSGEMQLQSVTTDANGKYLLRLAGTPKGIKRKITATASGYASQTQSVTVIAGQTTTAPDFLLSKGEEISKYIHLSVDTKKIPTNKQYKEDYTLLITLKNDSNVSILDWGYKFLEREGNKNWKNEANKWKTIGADYSDEDKLMGSTWVVESDTINHSWKWYYTDWLGAHKDCTEKTFQYRIWLGAERRSENVFDFETAEPEYLGATKVRVSEDKRTALTYYNMAYFGIGAATIILAIAAAVTTLGVSVAAAAAYAALTAGGGWLTQQEILSIIETWMKDPFKFDKNYKRIKQVKLSPHKKTSLINTIKNFRKLDSAILANRDKYWTALLLKDKQNAVKVRAELKKQIKQMICEVKRIDIFILKHKHKLKSAKVDLKSTKKLLCKGMPNKAQKTLRKIGLTNIQINNYRKLILSKYANKIKSKNALDILKTIKFIIKKILERNKSFLKA